jgi:hypothetical protein
MNDIKIYRNSAIILLKKIPSKIYYYNIIMIISLVFFISISIFYKYNKYIDYYGIVINSNIDIYVTESFFEKKDMSLLINNKIYKYAIKNIVPFSYYDSEIEYWKITIEIDLPKEWIIENNKLNLKFIKGKTNYADEIIKLIKKGIN